MDFAKALRGIYSLAECLASPTFFSVALHKNLPIKKQRELSKIRLLDSKGTLLTALEEQR
jgi:hypothetical protein